MMMSAVLGRPEKFKTHFSHIMASLYGIMLDAGRPAIRIFSPRT